MVGLRGLAAILDFQEGVESGVIIRKTNKMGRRRSKRKAPSKKKNDPLESQFNCPFCNHEKSCDVKM